MNVPTIKTNIKLNRYKCVRLYYYIKYKVEKHYDISESELDILTELYIFGGYHTKEEKKEFLHVCMARINSSSEQSIINSLSKMKKMGLLKKTGRNSLDIKELEDLPYLDSDLLAFMYLSTNVGDDKKV